MDHPEPPRKAFDMGNAAHAVVLGTGPELREIPADILASNGAISTKEAKQFVADARADGAVPLKPAEYRQIIDMADAIATHPIAGRLFHPDNGKPEQSMFWADERNGIMRRARLDWLPGLSHTGRLIIPDYKTTVCAEPWQWIRKAIDFGVHMQKANYIDGAKALRLADDVAFVNVAQEKTPPYLVSIIEVDQEGQFIGEDLMNLAARRFAECTRTGVWPGYGDHVTRVSLPRYYVTQTEEYLSEQQT